MFTHVPLTLPKAVQRNHSTGRVYEIVEGPHTGQTYPSITRVLAAKPKPELMAWRRRVGEAEANRISLEATTRGTALHTLAEAFLEEEDSRYNELFDATTIPVRELWSPVRDWLTAHVTTIHMQECDLFSPRLRVAGRTDLIAEVDGALSIVDFKTSRRPKKTNQIGDYYLQGTFYACALYELTGLMAKQIIFPITSPDGLQLFTTTPAHHFDALTSRIEEFYASVL